MPPFRRIVLSAAAAAFVCGALALSAPPAAAQSASSLPVPRFVSLRADEVNLRAGPGVQYPVEWVYRRRDLPMEVIAEFETWRKVRDWQGTQGWVHQSMLSGKRTFVVTGDMRTVRAEPKATGRAVAMAEPGVIGAFDGCAPAEEWCRVTIGAFDGWLRRVDVWGIYRGEPIE
jgi:SH3-like domain-containing protein